MKIGTGYDVHRLVYGRKLIIGGVDILSPRQSRWAFAVYFFSVRFFIFK